MTAPDTITVTSSAFPDGQPIPARFSCDGDNVSPPLAWRGVPPAAQAVALVVDDPDVPRVPSFTGCCSTSPRHHLAPRGLDTGRCHAGDQLGREGGSVLRTVSAQWHPSLPVHRLRVVIGNGPAGRRESRPGAAGD